MNHIELLRPGGLVVSPAFSHVAVIPPGATTIHVGGQNAVDGTGALVGGEDVALQTRQVMANLGTALAAAGATMADLVSVLVLMVDGTDLGNAYREAAAALGDNPEPPLVTAAIVHAGGPGSSGRGLGDRRTVPVNAERAPVGKTRDGGWQNRPVAGPRGRGPTWPLPRLRVRLRNVRL
jgi:enamine deaminase RidA (YjgF/YER057c/UK114 family)